MHPLIYTEIVNYLPQDRYFHTDCRAAFFVYENKSKFFEFLCCPIFPLRFFAISVFAIFYVFPLFNDLTKRQSPGGVLSNSVLKIFANL